MRIGVGVRVSLCGRITPAVRGVLSSSARVILGEPEVADTDEARAGACMQDERCQDGEKPSSRASPTPRHFA
jgi:hypothetical protein